jgi:hypothetical protein
MCVHPNTGNELRDHRVAHFGSVEAIDLGPYQRWAAKGWSRRVAYLHLHTDGTPFCPLSAIAHCQRSQDADGEEGHVV